MIFIYFQKDLVIKEINALDSEYTVNVCGSFRRGAATSGDIDILVTHPSYVSSAYLTENEKTIKKNKDKTIENSKNPKPLLKKIVDRFTNIKYITDTMAFGDTKFMGVCNLSSEYPFRRIDIRL